MLKAARCDYEARRDTLEHYWNYYTDARANIYREAMQQDLPPAVRTHVKGGLAEVIKGCCIGILQHHNTIPYCSDAEAQPCIPSDGPAQHLCGSVGARTRQYYD